MMFSNNFGQGQRGQALIMVLALLALGGITIATSLNYASTVLNNNRVLVNEMKGGYSAGAGIDYAIWALENGEETPETLLENINGMTVAIEQIDRGIFTLYCGELTYVGTLPEHYDWITVNSSATCGAGTCNYTVTVNWNGPPAQQRRLVELGATLPAGYSFISGSQADFPGNITITNPDETGQAQGGQQWIKWTWKAGKGPLISSDNATQTETFRISGAGDIEGDYCWVAAQSDDIGLVGEISGQRLTLTAIATNLDTGAISSEICSDILLAGGTAYIASWRVVR